MLTTKTTPTRSIRISVSICPTNLEVGSDVMNGDRYCEAIREAIEDRWPGAAAQVQVGYRQGDEWFRRDGIDSADVRAVVEAIDVSREELYSR